MVPGQLYLALILLGTMDTMLTTAHFLRSISCSFSRKNSFYVICLPFLSLI